MKYKQYLDLAVEVGTRTVRENSYEIAVGGAILGALLGLWIVTAILGSLWRLAFRRSRVSAGKASTKPRLNGLIRLAKVKRVRPEAEPIDPTKDQTAALLEVEFHRDRNGCVILSEPEIRQFKLIGSGGEADIYTVRETGRGDRVIKLFHQPGSSKYAGKKNEQEKAKIRLAEYELKLAQFPRGLSSNIVSPEEIVRDKKGRLIAYVMPLVDGGVSLDKYCVGERRPKGRPTREWISRCLAWGLRMIEIAEELHRSGVIIGDVKPENFMVMPDGSIRLVDAESMKFLAFPCHAYTPAYVDPLLLKIQEDGVSTVKVGQYTPQSDLYSIVAIVYELIVGSTPYHGQHFPKFPNGALPMPQAIRSIEGKSLFDNDMEPFAGAYPDILEGKLREFFYQVVEERRRFDKFPKEIFEEACEPAELAELRRLSNRFWESYQVGAFSGNSSTVLVHSRTLQAQIVAASGFGGRLVYAHEESDQLLLSDGTGLVDDFSGFRWAAIAHDTVVGANGDPEAYILRKGAEPIRIEVDTSIDGTPAIGLNERDSFLVRNRWLRRGSDPHKRLLKVARVPAIFYGPTFGVLVEVDSGKLAGVTVLDTVEKKLQPAEKLPYMRGDIKKVSATFNQSVCWLFFDTEATSAKWRYVVALNRQGKLLGFGTAEAGEQSWLGQGGAASAAYHPGSESRLLALHREAVEVVEIGGNNTVTSTQRWSVPEHLRSLSPIQIISLPNEIVMVSAGGLVHLNLPTA